MALWVGDQSAGPSRRTEPQRLSDGSVLPVPVLPM
jgi:hypothetical protein